MMFYRISFMIWRNYTEKLFLQKKHADKQLKKKQRLESHGRTYIPRVFEEEEGKKVIIDYEGEEEKILSSEEEPDEEIQSKLSIEKNSYRKKSTSIGER